jgi:hypothetical protein
MKFCRLPAGQGIRGSHVPLTAPIRSGAPSAPHQLKKCELVPIEGKISAPCGISQNGRCLLRSRCSNNFDASRRLPIKSTPLGVCKSTPIKTSPFGGGAWRVQRPTELCAAPALNAAGTKRLLTGSVSTRDAAHKLPDCRLSHWRVLWDAMREQAELRPRSLNLNRRTPEVFAGTFGLWVDL